MIGRYGWWAAVGRCLVDMAGRRVVMTGGYDWRAYCHMVGRWPVDMVGRLWFVEGKVDTPGR